MALKVTKDGIETDSQVDILDFNIDTSGVNLFTSQCKVQEGKQGTYTVTNCTTVNCTTIQCTTVDCTTINCTTVDCTTVKYTQDNNCSACSNDS